MALYIVVHHRLDAPHDKWKANKWHDDDRIASITTTPEIAEACRKADVVYVHRCCWKPKGGRYVKPSISCAARVSKIDNSRSQPTVHFHEVELVGKPVKRRLYGREQPFYSAPAP
jgi:hypothetical protein